MKDWSPEKAIALLMDNKVKGFRCTSCDGGKLTPWRFKSFICESCNTLYVWKVETQASNQAG